MTQDENEEFTVDDFAYALAQLTDDCEPMWIKQITGLSDDECFKIFQIAHAAQRKARG